MKKREIVAAARRGARYTPAHIDSRSAYAREHGQASVGPPTLDGKLISWSAGEYFERCAQELKARESFEQRVVRVEVRVHRSNAHFSRVFDAQAHPREIWDRLGKELPRLSKAQCFRATIDDHRVGGVWSQSRYWGVDQLLAEIGECWPLFIKGYIHTPLEENSDEEL